jgi:hypothetical protein
VLFLALRTLAVLGMNSVPVVARYRGIMLFRSRACLSLRLDISVPGFITATPGLLNCLFAFAGFNEFPLLLIEPARTFPVAFASIFFSPSP